MSDQGNQQNQQGGQQGGGGQKPGQQQQPNKKPDQAGKKQAELDKNWREVSDPGQEPGTGQTFLRRGDVLFSPGNGASFFATRHADVRRRIKSPRASTRSLNDDASN